MGGLVLGELTGEGLMNSYKPHLSWGLPASQDLLCLVETSCVLSKILAIFFLGGVLISWSLLAPAAKFFPILLLSLCRDTDSNVGCHPFPHSVLE